MSWQVVPSGMDEMLANPDTDSAKRAMQAMMQMRKIDLAALREAADGVPARKPRQEASRLAAIISAARSCAA